jgi:hypothetical protein
MERRMTQQIVWLSEGTTRPVDINSLKAGVADHGRYISGFIVKDARLYYSAKVRIVVEYADSRPQVEQFLSNIEWIIEHATGVRPTRQSQSNSEP